MRGILNKTNNNWTVKGYTRYDIIFNLHKDYIKEDIIDGQEVDFDVVEECSIHSTDTCGCKGRYEKYAVIYNYDYDEINEYLQSKQFQDDFSKQVEKDTWDKGLPKIYMDKNKQIVAHYKDGRIDVIKKQSN